jgi:hypothetical protein
LSILAIVVLGPIVSGIAYSLLKRRSVAKRELEALRSEIAQIRADMGEIKEQFADFIIKTH